MIYHICSGMTNYNYSKLISVFIFCKRCRSVMMISMMIMMILVMMVMVMIITMVVRMAQIKVAASPLKPEIRLHANSLVPNA